jgi:uncharacterized protein
LPAYFSAHTIKAVNIEYDEAKSTANNEKHGVPLSHAEFIEWDTLWSKPDDRYDYGEGRFIGYAYIGPRLFCVVFTDRGDVRRIISLRKANRREEALYAEA